MYFDLFKISRVMLYILKIAGTCLAVAYLKWDLSAVSCHKYI